MTVKIDRFGGISPRTHPTLLADGMAVRAHNVKLKNGKLVPIRQPASVQDDHGVFMQGGLSNVRNAQSMHVFRRYDGGFDFLAFSGMTWMAPGNLADDDLMRVIVSGDTGFTVQTGTTDFTQNTPVIFYRNESNALESAFLWKKALDAPIVTQPADGAPAPDPSNGQIRYTAFFLTWVDEFGYESPVSPASREIMYQDGDQIKIAMPTNFSSDARLVRVYKVVTGTETESIQYITEKEIDGTSNPITFIVKDEDAGEVLPEIEAPMPDLRNILDVPGAFYCGFSPSAPHTVAFSDVNLPYSWPIAYRYDVHDRIVALAVTSNSVFALTDGWPYVLSGTSPEGMTVTKLAGPASCISARSVCVYRNSVYYASPQGMMVIANSADAGTVCANLTDKIFTKDQWLALKPETCVCVQHDGALHLFFDGGKDDLGNPVTGLRIDLQEDGKVAVTTHDEVAACVCVDDEEDKMYYVRKMTEEA